MQSIRRKKLVYEDTGTSVLEHDDDYDSELIYIGNDRVYKGAIDPKYTEFGLDVRLPGMLFAAMRMSPVLGGTASSMDTQAALAIAGVENVVKIDAWGGGTGGVAVVGKSSGHAQLVSEAEWYSTNLSSLPHGLGYQAIIICVAIP